MRLQRRVVNMGLNISANPQKGAEVRIARTGVYGPTYAVGAPGKQAPALPADICHGMCQLRKALRKLRITTIYMYYRFFNIEAVLQWLCALTGWQVDGRGAAVRSRHPLRATLPVPSSAGSLFVQTTALLTCSITAHAPPRSIA
jgi:hypothetical protein